MITPSTLHNGESLKQQLSTMGIGKIDHLVLSHFHADHIAGIRDFPDALVHCHPEGYHHFMEAGRIKGVFRGYLKDLWLHDCSRKIRFIAEFPIDVGNIFNMPSGNIGLFAQDVFTDGSVYLVHLPGHSTGQIGVLLRLKDRFLFLLSDACWLRDNLHDEMEQVRVSDIFCSDRKTYISTLNKLRKCYQSVGDKVIFVPSHCYETVTALTDLGWIS